MLNRDRKHNKQMVQRILNQVADKLPTGDIQNCIELMAYDEWGPALDIICIQLIEYDIGIERPLFEEIKHACEQMGMGSKLWEPLKIQDD